MELDRGTLARIDRKLLARLGEDETYRMVRLPISEALWSAWKRCCDAAGMPMGRAVVALIVQELCTVTEGGHDVKGSVLEGRAGERLAAREARLDARERDVAVTEQRLRGWDERLRTREGELRAREQQFDLVAKFAVRSRGASPKVGRNERCPCGSGLKYKHCHGLSGPRVGPR